jgi:glucosyl-dolichyl phosphate glucuronosyltransferase
MNSVTIAVSTFRESYFGWVLELLHSLLQQTFDDFEILLVVNTDQKYFDKLEAIINNKMDKQHRIRIIFNPIDYGIAHARNVALKNVTTEYIAFTDDDAIPDNQWISESIKLLKETKSAGAVTGPVYAKWDPNCKKYASWFPKELYWIIGCTPWVRSDVGEIRNGFASNLTMRTNFALACGGFNERYGYNKLNPMAGEEPELSIRLRKNGKLTLWNPQAVVFHRIFKDRLRVRNIIVRSFVEGKTKAYLRKAFGSKALTYEMSHAKMILKAFLKTRSFTAKLLLAASTISVLLGYFVYLSEISSYDV